MTAVQQDPMGISDLERVRQTLGRLLGQTPGYVVDWDVVARTLGQESCSLVVGFTHPTTGKEVVWTLRGLEGGRVLHHDPLAGEPSEEVEGALLRVEGLPDRTRTGDGHVWIALEDLHKLFVEGSGRALMQA
ncbi:MAG: hypothetical protein VKP57_12710 [Candidatus Sericytochromatia bacterium]|nr:hypothetical protein [Candidatus Sericytochromatia bacterium]